jgi:hypothetical protein
MRKGEMVDHIVPTLANYLRFLAYLLSVSYALVFLCPIFHGSCPNFVALQAGQKCHGQFWVAPTYYSTFVGMVNL